jgi:hypothetical protein
MTERMQVGMRAWRIVGAMGLLFPLAGCPREVQPPPPGEARPCDSHADCNGGRTCGVLSLCVGGFCEAGEGTLAVPCPEAAADGE